VRARYTFGESELEARRLDLLDGVFGPASRALLREAASVAPALAYDLGAGTGRTTQMVAEVTGAPHTVGLERSPAHVERGRGLLGEDCTLVEWDVTVVPFPAGPAELIYGRLLLAHLPEPVAIAARWAGQLRPGGVLVLDEIEWIEASEPDLRAHLDLAGAVVATTGAVMCVGPALAGVAEIPGLRPRLRRVAEVPVATAAAASMFAMSQQGWGEQAVDAGLCSTGELARLQAATRRLRDSGASGEITWGLHQAVYEYTG
jgi:trans-aconitate 2-methyltransferase